MKVLVFPSSRPRRWSATPALAREVRAASPGRRHRPVEAGHTGRGRKNEAFAGERSPSERNRPPQMRGVSAASASAIRSTPRSRSEREQANEILM